MNEFECTFHEVPRTVEWKFKQGYQAELDVELSHFKAIRSSDGHVIIDESNVTMNDIDRFIEQISNL